ncbi:MAG: efflux RND transporter periplasmic adaptor subunit [Woeseiaceae bacterium]
MRPYRIAATAFTCILVLGACQQGEKSAENDEEETPPVPVEVSLPVRGDVYAVYSGTAPIEAFAQAVVIAKVPGEVKEILVEEGADVEKGQILARLDGDRLRLELNESKARLRKLERDFQRNKDLRSKALISEGDFDKIQYELEALQASYNLASLELDYTQIRAPIAGVVSERFIKLGNTLKVSDPVFSVTSLEPLVAYLFIPEREYRQIAPGQPVRINIDALGGTQILTAVTRVSPVVDPDTGTFKITIEIKDPQRRIKPGMFGRMSIVFDRHENALQIPRSAVLEEMGEMSVFVVEDNVAVRKAVQTGFSNNGLMEIIEGLNDDDRVITVGQVGLKQDAVVTIIGAEDDDADKQVDDADDENANTPAEGEG